MLRSVVRRLLSSKSSPSSGGLVPVGEVFSSRPPPSGTGKNKRKSYTEWIEGKRLSQYTVRILLEDARPDGLTRKQIWQLSKERLELKQFNSMTHLGIVLSNMREKRQIYARMAPNASNRKQPWIFYLFRKGQAKRKHELPKWAISVGKTASLTKYEKDRFRLMKQKMLKAGSWVKKKRTERPT